MNFAVIFTTYSCVSLNFGLATARRRAMDRSTWRLLVDAATSSWHTPERDRDRSYVAYIVIITFNFATFNRTQYNQLSLQAINKN